MITPMSNAESLQIGSVDFVSPDEIKIILDLDAPNDVALNTGVPRPFPRINSYVLIAGEGGFLVAQIEWITIERSQFPKRRGMQDFGILDLPYPLRKMSVIPLGVLKESIKEGDVVYSFTRGIEIFPTVGDPVLLPTQLQLKAIIESGDNRRVNIGISPLAGNAVVSVDPDRIFGRHLTLEVLQRYRRQEKGETLPTILVMEEAHTFIKRYNTDTENENATAMCTKVFERIAREGRKYGLGLVLSSQRPSELSPTVISQCNSFLLHRLSNDKDQELVGKLVPDNLRGLLRELPSLPSRNAILLGWASELPIMVRMNYLEEQYRPKSDDPEFWNVWTSSDRTVNWNTVAHRWQDYIETNPYSNNEEEETNG